jgi:hypothetical protein
MDQHIRPDFSNGTYIRELTEKKNKKLECLDKTASIEYLLNNHLISGNLVETEK